MDGGLENAIAACRTASELARRINVSRQAIGGWDRIPAERVIAVERATGVPRGVLRPDLYPPENQAAA